MFTIQNNCVLLLQEDAGRLVTCTQIEFEMVVVSFWPIVIILRTVMASLPHELPLDLLLTFRREYNINVVIWLGHRVPHVCISL